MGGSEEKFDAILSSLKTGKWNIWILFVASMWEMHLSSFVFSGAFTVPQVPHTCIATAPAAGPITTTTTAAATAKPGLDNYTSSIANETKEDLSCSLPDDPSRTCISWAFNDTVYGPTMTSEYGLVCDRAYLRGMYNSLYFFGALSGASFSGWLSDRFGRQRMFLLGTIVYSTIGCILPWIPNLSAILCLRFVLGFLQPVIGQPDFTLVMEVFERRWRSTAGIIIFLPWCFGIMLMAGVSAVVRNWRWLNFYLAIPNAVCPLLIWFCDESPRWLIVRGRHKEAYEVLKKAARWNNSSVPPYNEVLPLMEEIRLETTDNTATKRKGKLRLLWRFVDAYAVFFRTRKMRRRMPILWCIFLITNMTYTGLSLGGDIFSSDPYVYMAITGVMEIPGCAFIIPFVERFGRRRCSIVFYFLTGVSLLGISVTPDSLKWLVTSLALFGKLTLGSAFQTMYLHAGELIPTEIRAWGYGNCNMMGKIGATFSSFLVGVIPASYNAVPPIIFGTGCMIATALYVFLTGILPETTGAPLYDTVAALEASHPLSKADEARQGDSQQQEETLHLDTTTTTTTNIPTTTSNITINTTASVEEG